MRPGFFWRVAIPIALGVWLALRLTQGDTDADGEANEFVSNITVTEEESVSYQGLRTFEIRFADGTAVTIMGSKAVPVIQYLGLHGKKMIMEIRPFELQRIER